MKSFNLRETEEREREPGERERERERESFGETENGKMLHTLFPSSREWIKASWLDERRKRKPPASLVTIMLRVRKKIMRKKGIA